MPWNVLWVELLDRTRNTATLLPAGEALVDHARVLSATTSACGLARATVSQPSVRIAVAADHPLADREQDVVAIQRGCDPKSTAGPLAIDGFRGGRYRYIAMKDHTVLAMDVRKDAV